MSFQLISICVHSIAITHIFITSKWNIKLIACSFYFALDLIHWDMVTRINRMVNEWSAVADKSLALIISLSHSVWKISVHCLRNHDLVLSMIWIRSESNLYAYKCLVLCRTPMVDHVIGSAKIMLQYSMRSHAFIQ